MSEKKYPVSRGKEYEFTIEKLAFGGAGVARVEDYVVFVKKTLPGDTVRARIQKRKPAYAEARLLEVLKPSSLRQAAPCPYFGWCGGCTWQNLSYENQLIAKKEMVRESLEHLAGLQNPPVADVLPSDKSFYYRNKMEFSFSDRRWLLPQEIGDESINRAFALGLHVPGTFDKILQIEACLLQSEEANAVLKYLSGYAQKNNLAPYGLKTQQGFLRFLVLRQSSFDRSIMVNIVTGYEQRELLQPLANALTQRFPQVVSVVNNINTRPAQVATGEKEILLAGRPVIQDKIGPFSFNISANSFFQTNTAQAEKLYAQALDFAEIEQNDVVWDLYAGAGTITLFLAQQAREVIGFELAESAVADGEENARTHGATNIRFVAGDLLHRLQETQPKPRVLLTDPPRAGMHEKVVRYIREMAPQRIVYVSCNPTTLARDLAILKEAYHIEAVQPVDMFPQTYHIETVVKLTLK